MCLRTGRDSLTGVHTAFVSAGHEPPLFDGKVVVLMHGWFSRIAPAGLSWF
jgi:hypothetical protein